MRRGANSQADTVKSSQGLSPGSRSPQPDKLGSLAGLHVLVIGLGRFGGGTGVVRWLVGQGAVVTVTDHASRDTLTESLDALADLNLSFRFGKHELDDLDAANLVVVNPAVDKRASELLRTAVSRGIAWTTEINLLCERCSCRVIAVTGSYGKSTTCAMLADALEACRSAGVVPYTGVHLGGNIGGSLLTRLDRIQPTDLVVLEMSSAQLEDLPRISWAPSVAVITNLFPHHLDRYGTYGEYVTAKLNVIGQPHLADAVIVGDLDSAAETTLQHRLHGADDRLVRATRLERSVDLLIPGEHNRANAALVLAVCHHLDLDQSVARNALRSFPGLPHRLEPVRTLDGIDYYDDSKSTSPAATIRAIGTLRRPIVAIVGGQDKAVSLTECAKALAQACSAVICIGESGPAFARAVRIVTGSGNHEAVCEAGSLAEAVELARARAKLGDAVLFSPGAPSFDAYANFAERGRDFVDAVNALS